MGSIQITWAQKVNEYTISAHFFPSDAQMWGYPVSEKAFMRGNAKVKFSEVNVGTPQFYLHGELKIDSITSGKTTLEYESERVFYEKDYSNVGLKTTISFPAAIEERTVEVHYSGFMNPSRSRSLSDYMRINKDEGVFLRGYYYSPWFPVFQGPEQDDPEVEFRQITLRLPSGFKAVVTGELLSEKLEGDVYTAIWKPGMAKTSDIQCTARPYKIIHSDNIFVYYLDDVQSGEKIIDYTQGLKYFFGTNLRSVHNTDPLYILEMPDYGNISSQNVIGVSSDLYKDFDSDQNSKLTIAHELVHPYVSIPIEKENPLSALIIEGFPGFFHLYGLAKVSDDFHLKGYMERIETSYLKKKQTGKDGRGNLLPLDKPITDITFDEIGQYKDLFILSDRVRLFLYHLLNKMGDEKYQEFLVELFQLDSIDYEILESLVVSYLPGYERSLDLWLNTVEYPKSLYINEIR